MSAAKRLSARQKKDQSLAFLDFLEDNDLVNSSTNKETLRQIYTYQFKYAWQNQSDLPLMNFASSIYELKKRGFMSISKEGRVKYTYDLSPRHSQEPMVGNSSSACDQNSPKAPKKGRSHAAVVRLAVDQHITSPRGLEDLEEHEEDSHQDSPAAASQASEPSLPRGIKKKGRFYSCELCKVMMTSLSDLQAHVAGKKHRVQNLVTNLKENKEHLVKNRDSIEIVSNFDGPQGTVRLEVEDGQKCDIEFTITNKGDKEITLVACELLRRIRIFQLQDAQGVCDGMGKATISPGEKYQVYVSVNPGHIGRFHRPLGFAFKTTYSGEKRLHMVRYISVRCKSAVLEELMPKVPYKQPPRKTQNAPSADIIDGVRPSRMQEDSLEKEVTVDNYSIEQSLRHAMNHGLKPWQNISDKDKEQLAKVRAALHNGLSMDRYQSIFSTLLHMEEMQMEVDIRKYDMDKVPMKLDKENKNLLVLKVPGLAENRPSVLKGDTLYVRMVTADGVSKKEYRGYVHQVRQDEVCLGFHESLLRSFIDGMQFNVRFTFNRLPLKLQHRATKLAEENSLGRILFPDSSTICSHGLMQPVDSPLGWKNRLLEQNAEQMYAVQHIVAGSSRPAPYLVFGPPGTGKTVTIVEAMKQVLISVPNAHILACAPSNSAADLIAARLLQHVDKGKILRLNASSRSWLEVAHAVKHVCNRVGDHYVYPSKKHLLKYHVIVTTLVTAGRIASANFPPGHFTHIFIDEAGHAVEPESVIAIANILECDINQKYGGQVVLAGDPRQLGPVLRSPVVMKYGLDVSLLERLMNSEVYSKKKEEDPSYDPRVLTKLLRNYRSHPEILAIPNAAFYDRELIPCADELDRNSLCHWEVLPKKGFPMLFHGVEGQDMREERSPSFFNPEEVVVVEKYVRQLLEARGGGINVKPKDIGIITPYRKQVQKISRRMEANKWKDVKVGSVEEFQGQERRVIIISTVRSNSEYLPLDSQFKLGFLKNPKRFNVAITRAKSLVILVGNPNLLSRDQHWNMLLKQCRDVGAYVGCDFEEPEEDFEDILQRFQALNLLDIGTDLDSNVQQQLDPEWKSEH